jgi:hypothetical protein
MYHRTRVYKQKTCLRCESVFTPNSPTQKYCTLCIPIVSRERARSRYENRDEDVWRKRSWENQRRLKLDVFSHYCSGELACSRCGFKDVRALLLHHIEGNSYKHRERLGMDKRYLGGTVFYRALKHNGYPKYPPLIVICANCHRIEHGKSYEEVRYRV